MEKNRRKRFFITTLALASLLTGTAALTVMAETEAAAGQESEAAAEKIFDAGGFSVTVPQDIISISDIDVGDNTISFYEKLSHEGSSAGFACSVGLYSSVADYAYIPSFEKAGEIRYSDDTVMAVVICYPTDVQFDPADETAATNYMTLYEAVKDGTAFSVLAPEDAVYLTQDELDYTSIYDDTLALLKADLTAGKTADEFEADGFSRLYSYFTENEGASSIGYCFVDMNGIGYPQLAIMNMDNGSIMDLYAQVEGEIIHLLSGEERIQYSFYGYENKVRGIREDGSSSAFHSESAFYILNPLSSDLEFQVRFIYDGEKDPENPYFVSYFGDEEPEPLSEEDWKQRLGNFSDPIVPELTPLTNDEAEAVA